MKPSTQDFLAAGYCRKKRPYLGETSLLWEPYHKRRPEGSLPRPHLVCFFYE